MNCEKIKELILTDYIDNQMSRQEKMRLDMHLARCQGCKEFLETVKNTVIEPFADAKELVPPEFIWQRIKETIISERQETRSFVAGILGKLRLIFSIPRSALAMSTITAITLIVMLTATLRFSNKEAREVQSEYSVWSMEIPVSTFLNNDGGFGTSIEEYFL